MGARSRVEVEDVDVVFGEGGEEGVEGWWGVGEGEERDGWLGAGWGRWIGGGWAFGGSVFGHFCSGRELREWVGGTWVVGVIGSLLLLLEGWGYRVGAWHLVQGKKRVKGKYSMSYTRWVVRLCSCDRLYCRA